MKKITFLSAVLLLGASSVFAQTAVPSATSTPAAGKTLTCKNNAGTLTVGICGIKGCDVKVTLKDSSTSSTYVTKRTKASDGALTYKTGKSVTPKCTIVIGPLSKGTRLVNNATCAKTLKGAKCNIS